MGWKIIFAAFLVVSLAQAKGNKPLEAALGISEKKTPKISFNENDKDKNRSLGKEEIDRIFLSFMAEKKKEAKERKMRLDRIKRLKSSKDNKRSGSKTRFIPQYSVEEQKRSIESGKNNKKNKPRTIAMASFTIYGTSCVYGTCILFTSVGNLKVGDTISATKEKIEVITPYVVKTSLRKIKL